MFKWLYANTPKKLIERELEESNKLLLQSHTNQEHWQSQIDYHQKKIKRLTASWNKLQSEEKEKNNG